MLDYGGKFQRQSGKRQFQFIELINMDDACGRDNEGQPKYVVSLRLVDLDAIPQKEQDSAIKSCGWDNMNGDVMLAECCDSYGCHAPLEQWSGNNGNALLKEAKREANRLLESSELERQLDRPVNKIGSSAREFMAGDVFSAIQRGCESGNADSRIMAKMYGVSQVAIDDTRPADWLPYVMGYSAGMAGQPKETDPDIVPEYFRGYDRALNVKAGKCPAPSWIQSAN